MKKIHLFSSLLIILLALSACSEDDQTLSSQQIDQTIITEYHKISGNGGGIYEKYKFNNEGLLSQHYAIYNDYTLNYSYNSEKKLINISKKDLNNNLIEETNILYDNNDRVIKVDQLDYVYHEVEDYYHSGEGYDSPIISIENYNGDNIESSLREYNAYKDSNFDGVFEHCYYFDAELTNLTTGQYIGNDIETYYNSSPFNFYWHDGENLTASNEYNRRTHDANTNPLYNNTSNIKYVIGFLHSDYSDGNIYPDIISKNNVIHHDWDVDGPEETAYIYDFNNHNLPVNRYSQYYYTGNSEGGQYLSAKYYYQGDIIPE